MTAMAARQVPVIAVGGSADGVHALRAIVSALPVDLPAAVIIIQHLADGREPRLPSVLGRVTRLPVKDPVHGEALVAGTVYVARPGLHLVVDDGAVRLEPGEKINYSRPSIDVLFSSVARACGERGVGVLLSGGGRDGAEGLAEIRKSGGATFVQDPEEAAYPRMPLSALALDGHRVLRLAEIGPALALAAEGLADPSTEHLETDPTT
jgi:two-component system chemotaxis response regulator CheB